MTPRWYVAKVETNCERRAVRHSQRFQIETFLPEIEQRVTGRGQTRRVLMFPNYLFVRFADLNNWCRAKRDGYVFSYLLGGGDNGMQAVGDAVVGNLQARMVDGVIPATATVSQFHEGQRVRVARGQYADFIGEVTSTAEARVSVLLTLFNRQLTAELDDGLVIAA